MILLITGGLYYYISPSEKLNLAYSEVSAVQKVRQMIANRHFELQLNEDDVNNILKQELSMHPEIKNHWVVQGARFTLDGQQLNALFNITYNHLLTTEMMCTYQLKWEAPNLVFIPVKYQLKDIPLPVNWVGTTPIQINFDSQLPSFLAIRSMAFQDRSILIQFRVKGW